MKNQMTLPTALGIATKSQIIDVATLVNLLTNTTKSTVCHLVYLVDDSRSKMIQGKKQVQKLVEVSHVYLNHNYTNKVKNLTENSDFVARPLEDFGKTRICSTIIASLKNGAMMIDGKVLNSNVSKILAFFHNGVEITATEAEAQNLWANAYYTPQEKTTMGRGSVAVEDDFYIINTYLERIKHIKLNGQWYSIN